jgi:hypothetical protein
MIMNALGIIIRFLAPNVSMETEVTMHHKLYNLSQGYNQENTNTRADWIKLLPA